MNTQHVVVAPQNDKNIQDVARQTRYDIRRALLLQLYAHENLMVACGDISPEYTIKSLRAQVKERGKDQGENQNAEE